MNWKQDLVNECMIVDQHGNEIAETKGDYSQEWKAMEANARLIAAAPDLLAACEWCANWADTYADANVLPVVKALKAALVKARGEK